MKTPYVNRRPAVRPNQDSADGYGAVGRRVRVGGLPTAPWRTIVGVVGDVRHTELTEQPSPQMYLPQSQFTDSFLVLAIKTAHNRAGGAG